MSLQNQITARQLWGFAFLSNRERLKIRVCCVENPAECAIIVAREKIFSISNLKFNLLSHYSWLISWDQSCCQVLSSLSCYIWSSSWYQKNVAWPLQLRVMNIPLSVSEFWNHHHRDDLLSLSLFRSVHPDPSWVTFILNWHKIAIVCSISAC